MSFRCKNGAEHYHNTILESQICWGIVPAPAPARPVRFATEAQLKYIKDLGGDVEHAKHLKIHDASSYIDELKRRPKKVDVPEPAPATVEDRRLEFVKGMVPSIDSGYYAIQKEEGAEIFFMRVSRPKSGKYKDAVKLQSVHGTAAAKPRLMDAMVLYPSGKYYFMDRYFKDHYHRERLIEAIMLLVTDAWGAQRRYAEKIGRCCRCNAVLTDDKSRHYGIGPECEHYWPHIIEMVDAAEALKES